MASKTIFITGVSGTGKSTVCRALAAKGYTTIGLDEMPGLSCWIHKQTREKLDKKADFSEEFLATYEWVCDMASLKELVAKKEGLVFIAGNVENVLECITFAGKSFVLICSPETFLKRINGREDNEYGKDEDARNFLLSYYQSDNKKCLEAGAIAVDAELPLEQVVENILDKCNY